jgi:acyl-CoA synthetase (AMP-forming)/AMP-acid ligase II
MTEARDVRSNVVELFERAARQRGRAAALVGHDGAVLWTFADLAEATARVAGALAALGIGPGDRVLALESDPRRRHAVIGGVLWAGATLVIPPTTVSPWRALTIAGSPAPRAAIFEPRLWPLVAAHPALRRVPYRLVTAGPRLPGCIRLAADDAAPIDAVGVPGAAGALVSFTTGSTGAPTPVIRSHGVLRAQHDALADLRRHSTGDRDLVGLPLLALHNLAAGVTSILPPPAMSRRYGPRLRESIARTRPTTACGFPHLFETAVEVGASGLRDLRAIHLGGSRVRAELLVALRGLAPSTRTTVVYGSTQVEPIAAIDAEDYLDALAEVGPPSGVCVGRPVAGLDVRIEPAPGCTSELPERDVGALLVRGARAAGAGGPAGIDGPGWVATGDIGWRDGQGRLWLLGRLAHAVGGLYPFEVELAVEALGWPRRAALVRPDGLGPTWPTVAVEPAVGTSMARADCVRAIEDLASERGWSISGVIVRDRLPLVRGPSAKVDAGRLARERVTARGGRASRIASRGGIA